MVRTAKAQTKGVPVRPRLALKVAACYIGKLGIDHVPSMSGRKSAFANICLLSQGL
jgi:hypothetical protein